MGETGSPQALRFFTYTTAAGNVVLSSTHFVVVVAIKLLGLFCMRAGLVDPDSRVWSLKRDFSSRKASKAGVRLAQRAGF